MPIRPIDVRRKEFRNSLRGYDANQVDDFLDAVADEFERAYTDNSRMREEISNLRERLQQFEELEGSIRSALVHAEQAADDLRHSASREAEDLRASAAREAEFTIREAKARSHQMLAESSARVERIQESYEALQEAKRNFANDFRYLLKSYMEMMDNMEISSAKEIETSLRQRLDTESIAVAREAAAYEEESATPEVAEESGVEIESEGYTVEDAGATQPIEPTVGEEPLQIDEQEAEPPDAQSEEPPVSSQEPDVPPAAEEETMVEEPPPVEASAVVEEPAPEEEATAAEEVEREEPTLAEESSSQGFFDHEEGRTSSEEESGRDNRIFRASRFLRRRE
jgi:cell division initiation protein